MCQAMGIEDSEISKIIFPPRSSEAQADDFNSRWPSQGESLPRVFWELRGKMFN